MAGNRVAIVDARSSACCTDEAKSKEMLKVYLELLLGFIGFTDINNILIKPILAAPDDVASTIESAKGVAREIARKQ